MFGFVCYSNQSEALPEIVHLKGIIEEFIWKSLFVMG
jgi:hypothetical protein